MVLILRDHCTVENGVGDYSVMGGEDIILQNNCSCHNGLRKEGTEGQENEYTMYIFDHAKRAGTKKSFKRRL